MSTPEDVLRKLAKLPQNVRCANCDKEDKIFGFKNICMPFRTFVCSMCKAAHQSFSHRVKEVNQSNFSGAEVDSLRPPKGSNDLARRTWLGKCPPESLDRPREGDPLEKYKAFVLAAYENRRWYVDAPAPGEEDLNSSTGSISSTASGMGMGGGGGGGAAAAPAAIIGATGGRAKWGPTATTSAAPAQHHHHQQQLPTPSQAAAAPLRVPVPPPPQPEPEIDLLGMGTPISATPTVSPPTSVSSSSFPGDLFSTVVPAAPPPQQQQQQQVFFPSSGASAFPSAPLPPPTAGGFSFLAAPPPPPTALPAAGGGSGFDFLGMGGGGGAAPSQPLAPLSVGIPAGGGGGGFGGMAVPALSPMTPSNTPMSLGNNTISDVFASAITLPPPTHQQPYNPAQQAQALYYAQQQQQAHARAMYMAQQQQQQQQAAALQAQLAASRGVAMGGGAPRAFQPPSFGGSPDPFFGM